MLEFVQTCPKTNAIRGIPGNGDMAKHVMTNRSFGFY